MDSERRYSEDEVSEILDRATETHAGGDSPGGPGGLTLRELHEIGREVGIPQDAISQAAASLERPGADIDADRRFLGQQIGVGRTVHFPRPLTDQEWHRLVLDLRETFDAKGRIREEGAFRQWTNSNLQALLEPTESGERLRLRTLKGSARPYQTMGGMFVALGATMGFLGLSDPRQTLLFVLMGAGFFLSSRLTVPGWAKTRLRQFDAVIRRLKDTMGSLPAEPERERLAGSDN